jgi:hypothetical protein
MLSGEGPGGRQGGLETSCDLPGPGNDVVHGPHFDMPPRVAVRAQTDSGRCNRRGDANI